MKKDEVIDIARMAGAHDDEERFEFHQYKYLERFVTEVERRTLERAAVVCEASPSYDWHKFACEAAAAIRALKEEV